MARKMYVSKAKTTVISADVKMTVKIRDNYYSVAGHEERSVPPDDDVELDKEWEFLYEELYNEVEMELREIKASVRTKR